MDNSTDKLVKPEDEILIRNPVQCASNVLQPDSVTGDESAIHVSENEASHLDTHMEDESLIFCCQHNAPYVMSLALENTFNDPMSKHAPHRIQLGLQMLGSAAHLCCFRNSDGQYFHQVIEKFEPYSTGDRAAVIVSLPHELLEHCRLAQRKAVQTRPSVSKFMVMRAFVHIFLEDLYVEPLTGKRFGFREPWNCHLAFYYYESRTHWPRAQNSLIQEQNRALLKHYWIGSGMPNYGEVINHLEGFGPQLEFLNPKWFLRVVLFPSLLLSNEACETFLERLDELLFGEEKSLLRKFAKQDVGGKSHSKFRFSYAWRPVSSDQRMDQFVTFLHNYHNLLKDMAYGECDGYARPHEKHSLKNFSSARVVINEESQHPLVFGTFMLGKRQYEFGSGLEISILQFKEEALRDFVSDWSLQWKLTSSEQKREAFCLTHEPTNDTREGVSYPLQPTCLQNLPGISDDFFVEYFDSLVTDFGKELLRSSSEEPSFWQLVSEVHSALAHHIEYQLSQQLVIGSVSQQQDLVDEPPFYALYRSRTRFPLFNLTYSIKS